MSAIERRFLLARHKYAGLSFAGAMTRSPLWLGPLMFFCVGKLPRGWWR